MRDDNKLALKMNKQQIISFFLRHNCSFPSNNHWIQAYLRWLREIKLGDVYQEILEKYLLTYSNLEDKLERLDKRIDALVAVGGKLIFCPKITLPPTGRFGYFIC